MTSEHLHLWNVCMPPYRARHKQLNNALLHSAPKDEVEALIGACLSPEHDSARAELILYRQTWTGWTEEKCLAEHESVYHTLATLSHRIDDSRPPFDKTGQTIDLVHRIVRDESIRGRIKKDLLGISESISDTSSSPRELLTASMGVAIMDALQLTLEESRNIPNALTPKVLSLLQDISDLTEKLPRKLWIKGVIWPEQDGPDHSGGEAEIFKCTYNGQKVACRNIKLAGYKGNVQECRKAIRREIIAQCQMSHPNVLQILGVCGGERHEMSIVSPWMDGTAMKYLEQHQNREDFLRIIQGVARGIAYLHSLSPPIFHGDICARNILVHKGEAIVADFGFARIEHDETRTLTAKAEVCLSLRHMAPERVISAVKELRPTAAGDIYALSMTLLELGTLADPFSNNKNAWSVSIEAANGIRPEMPHSLGSLGPRSTKRLYGILAIMWGDNPLQRPSAHKVVEELRSFADELTGSASVAISAPEGHEFSASLSPLVESPMQLYPELPSLPPRRRRPRDPLAIGSVRPLSPTDQSQMQNRRIKGVLQATRAYTGKNEDELSFGTEDVIGLLVEQDGMYLGIVLGSGEWEGGKRHLSNSDKPGLFPKDCAQVKSRFDK